MHDFYNEPLLSTPRDPKKFGEEPWRDINTPHAMIIVGDKRSGKDVAMDKEKRICYDTYMTCLSIYDGGGRESVYIAKQKNCKLKWQRVESILQTFIDKDESILKINDVKEMCSLDEKLFNNLLSAMESEKMIKTGKKEIGILQKGMDVLDGKLLHCNCDKPLPATMLIPEYCSFNKTDVDRFNGHYFSGYEEYNNAYVKCLVHEYLPPAFDAFKKIKKPQTMIEKIKPMLEIWKAPVPRNRKGERGKLEAFQKRFTEFMLYNREHHRFGIGLDPQSFPENHEGKLDKYTWFAEIIRYLKPLSDKHFRMRNDKPRSQLSDKEKSHHKIALFISEVREPVPSQSLSGDVEATISKRAFYNFMPKSRHAKCWPRVNAQSIGDVLKGVNKQQDLIVVKRSSERNLGSELEWFAKEIREKIRETLVKWDIWYYDEHSKLITGRISPMIKHNLISKEELWYVDSLPDDKAYVINGDGQRLMTEYSTQSWHHKSDRDNFESDFGIEIKISSKIDNDDETELVSKNLKKSKTSKSEIKQKVMIKLHEMITKQENPKPDYKSAHQELIQFYNNEPDCKEYVENLKPKSLAKNYQRWRDSEK